MKIKRRALMLATAAWPLAGGAQQSKKVWRIGYLRGTPGIEVTDEAFRQRLRELGFVEGKNLVIEWRFLQGRPERAPEGGVGDAQKAHYRGTEDAATKLGMESRLFALQSIGELEGLFSRAADWRPDALSFFSGGWFRGNRARIMDWVVRMKLPAVYSNTEFVKNGGLIGYSDDAVHRFREVAEYVAKILSGVRPADLPVQQPTNFQLAINLKTAKALGITVPQSIMLRADKVIQ